MNSVSPVKINGGDEGEDIGKVNGRPRGGPNGESPIAALEVATFMPFWSMIRLNFFCSNSFWIL